MNETEINAKHRHLYCQECRSLLLPGKSGATCPKGHGKVQALAVGDRRALNKLWKNSTQPAPSKHHPALRTMHAQDQAKRGTQDPYKA